MIQTALSAPAPDPGTSPDRSPPWLRWLLFALLYALLQWAYTALRSSAWDGWFIHRLTAQPAAALVGWAFPVDEVQAIGPRLVWPSGRLTLLAGCDGFEVMALFVAAMLVAHVGWRRGLAGLLVGCAGLWLLNQVRLLALYASFRYARGWFDALHTLWGPLLLVAWAAGVYATTVWWPRRWTPSDAMAHRMSPPAVEHRIAT